jgi:hypothetical protein
MDSIDWHESWQRYMVFQDIFCDPEVAARWKEHFLFLGAHDDFRLHFSAILQFDVAERTRYSINPRAFNKENYLRHLESMKLEVMSATICNATHELGQDSQPSGSKAHFQPYNQEFRKFRPALSDSKSSFHERDSKGDTSRSLPLCLCCKRTGHKFSDCTEDTTPAGVPTYSRYLDGKLTLLPSSSALLSNSTLPNNTVRQTTLSNMPVRGVAPPIMELVHESVFEVSTTLQPFLETPLASTPLYRDWRSPVPVPDSFVSTPHVYYDNLQIEQPSPYDNDCDYSKILTPYSAAQFQIFLERSQLLSHYPELPFKLTHGIPIGNLAPLKQTFTPPNLPGADIYADTIHASISEELRLGRFSGPFTLDELKAKFGFFRSSPLQVDVKEGAPGQPPKHRVCHHLSYKGKAPSPLSTMKSIQMIFPLVGGKHLMSLKLFS